MKLLPFLFAIATAALVVVMPSAGAAILVAFGGGVSVGLFLGLILLDDRRREDV